MGVPLGFEKLRALSNGARLLSNLSYGVDALTCVFILIVSVLRKLKQESMYADLLDDISRNM